MANKIKYGLSKVYYAVATIATDGSATFGTPVAIPGAVSLSMEPQGDNTTFYADNIAYWVGNGATGYQGDLEVALIPESFKTDILGFVADANGVLVEDLNSEIGHFALLFQFEGDQKATRHVLYNCTCTRPAAAGQTKGESVEPQTETITITATSVYFASLGKDVPKASTAAGTDTTEYNGWFTDVYVPTPATTTPTT